MMYPPKTVTPEGLQPTGPERAGRADGVIGGGRADGANGGGRSDVAGGRPDQSILRGVGSPAQYVSKGSMAAFITYVKALDTTDRTSAERAVLVDRIRELKPALRAVGLFDVMDVRDPEVAAILGM